MVNRYEHAKLNINDKGKRYLGSIKYPQIPYRSNDIYIYPNIGDRLDKLALSYYKDKTLWWVISIANNIPRDTFNIPPGIQIRIPQNIQSILSQFKVINER